MKQNDRLRTDSLVSCPIGDGMVYEFAVPAYT